MTVFAPPDPSLTAALQQELRAAREQLDAVTALTGAGVLTLDASGRVEDANPAAERLLGALPGDLAGHTLRFEDAAVLGLDGLPVAAACRVSPCALPDGGCGVLVVLCAGPDADDDRARWARDAETLTWVRRVREALAADRLVLYAQPIIDLATGATVKHELLIRMLDEQGELVPPGDFLPAAERHGFIRVIDRWVIRRAIAIAAAGHAVELNVSAESLGDRGLADFVAAEIAAAGADPAKLVFELTETALLRDEAAGEVFVAALDELGCEVALDDFGTGYGGFTYLKRLAVDYLKIDVEFVRDLPRDAASQHVVRAVVDLARGFGRRTVAEGVEDDETHAMLRAMGVDCAQGYGIGRPRPVADELGFAP
jgi:EAL domain-containing protein (putative c-di-GMP-specific phosphodiesterase class I)